MGLHLDFWKEKADLGRQTIEVGGEEFGIMSLTEDMIDEALEVTGYDEVIEFCADRGLMLEGKRIFDDEYMRGDIEEYWGFIDSKLNLDPEVRHQIGLKVCEKSELLDHAESFLVTEEIDKSKTLGELNGETEQDGEVIDVNNGRFDNQSNAA